VDSASFELAQLGWFEVHFSELRTVLDADILRPQAPPGIKGISPEHPIDQTRRRVVEQKTQIKIRLPSSAPDQAIFAILLDRLQHLAT
jgi:hypothetical protein